MGMAERSITTRSEPGIMGGLFRGSDHFGGASSASSIHVDPATGKPAAGGSRMSDEQSVSCRSTNSMESLGKPKRETMGTQRWSVNFSEVAPPQSVSPRRRMRRSVSPRKMSGRTIQSTTHPEVQAQTTGTTRVSNPQHLVATKNGFKTMELRSSQSSSTTSEVQVQTTRASGSMPNHPALESDSAVANLPMTGAWNQDRKPKLSFRDPSVIRESSEIEKKLLAAAAQQKSLRSSRSASEVHVQTTRASGSMQNHTWDAVAPLPLTGAGNQERKPKLSFLEPSVIDDSSSEIEKKLLAAAAQHKSLSNNRHVAAATNGNKTKGLRPSQSASEVNAQRRASGSMQNHTWDSVDPLPLTGAGNQGRKPKLSFLEPCVIDDSSSEPEKKLVAAAAAAQEKSRSYNRSASERKLKCSEPKEEKKPPSRTRSSCDLVPKSSKPEDKPQAVTESPRRALRRRMSSVRTLVAEEQKEKTSSDTKNDPLCEPISMLDLIPPESPKTGSCLSRKKNQRASGDRQIKKKAVRFATDPSTGKIWCLEHSYDKVSSSRKDVVWWNEADYDARFNQDTDVVQLVEELYQGVLLDAMKSSQQPGASLDTVVLDFEDMATCAIARGLESEVFPKIGDHKEYHRQLVLDAQTCNSSNSMIRHESLKGSRESQLVAAKMAQYDMYAAWEKEKQRPSTVCIE